MLGRKEKLKDINILEECLIPEQILLAKFMQPARKAGFKYWKL